MIYQNFAIVRVRVRFPARTDGGATTSSGSELWRAHSVWWPLSASRGANSSGAEVRVPTTLTKGVTTPHSAGRGDGVGSRAWLDGQRMAPGLGARHNIAVSHNHFGCGGDSVRGGAGSQQLRQRPSATTHDHLGSRRRQQQRPGVAARGDMVSRRWRLGARRCGVPTVFVESGRRGSCRHRVPAVATQAERGPREGPGRARSQRRWCRPSIVV